MPVKIYLTAHRLSFSLTATSLTPRTSCFPILINRNCFYIFFCPRWYLTSSSPGQKLKVCKETVTKDKYARRYLKPIPMVHTGKWHLVKILSSLPGTSNSACFHWTSSTHFSQMTSFILLGLACAWKKRSHQPMSSSEGPCSVTPES